MSNKTKRAVGALEISWVIPTHLTNTQVFPKKLNPTSESCNTYKFQSNNFQNIQSFIGKWRNRQAMSFSPNGDFLAVGFKDNMFVWKVSEGRVCFQKLLPTTLKYEDVKFLNSNSDSNATDIDLSTATDDGEVRHERILPNGNAVQLNACYLRVHSLELTPSPQNAYQVLCNANRRQIYNIDFRCSNVDLRPVVSLEAGKRRLISLKHHPSAPEICFGTAFNTVRVYDKRNFDKPLKELQPELPEVCGRRSITSCLYNFDGSEIAAFYSNDLVGFFESNCEGRQQFKYYDFNAPNLSFNYFGQKSEFIIRCHHGGGRYLLDKRTGQEYYAYTTPYYCLNFATHPTLPIRAEAKPDGLDIYAAVVA